MSFARILMAVSVVIALVSCALPACAGKPHERTGFYIGFGLGFGGANWKLGSLLDGSSEDSGGGAVNFRLGGALRTDVALGLETSTWARSENDVTLTFSAVTAALTWWPGNVGAYLRGGFGFASSTAEVDLGGGLKASKDEGGWGFLGAGGYEWRLTDKFALGPQIEVVYMGLDGELIDTSSIINVTAQLNWYW